MIPSGRCYSFDYPEEGFERADPINPQLFTPCLRPIFDPEYGIFDPVIFSHYLVTLPPIAACPEVINKYTVRFFAISKKDPTRITSVKEIEKGSKISIFFHPYMTEYDEKMVLGPPFATLTTNDWAIVADYSRLEFSRVFGRIRIPIINAFLSLSNTILMGRISCKFIKFMIEKHGIQSEDILLAGFSAGAQTIGFLADYCRGRYGIRFNHIVGK